jgi:transcriptional regulator with XRE-family HTH domain
MEENKGILMELRDKLMKAIGERTSGLRADSKRSQPEMLAELAKYGLGRSQPNLSQIENGKRIPSVEALYIIAQFLETSTDYLLGLTTNQLSAAESEEELAAARGEAHINKVMRHMSKERQKQVVAFAEYLLSQERQNPTGVAPLISPLPLTEREQNLATVKKMLESVERKHGVEARRDMERSIREEFDDIDAEV